MKIITKNKRAYFDYTFSKFYEAGIVLQWHEVKSIKTSNVNLRDSFARLEWKEIFLLNMDVPLYKYTSRVLAPNYNSKWKRKLLLNRREIGKIAWELDKPGNVLVPLEIYIKKNGRIKLKIWIWKLKRKVEKKQILKEKDIKRQMNRDIKNYG